MMEKQTGRKIKVLQIDIVGEYKNQFNDLTRTLVFIFTSQLENMGMVKEMNRSLLDKVWGCCLMHN